MNIKKTHLLFILIFGISQESFTQNPNFSSGLAHYANVQVFRLKAWTIMTKKEWGHVIYRFPEFQEGRITLLEGFSPEHSLRFNYNIYEERIEFITEKGDTSTLKNSSQLKSVTIGDHVFYDDYPAGYIEKINQTPLALGAKHLLKMMFESASGERFAATDLHQPTTRLDRLYVKQQEYYFIDKNDKLYRATLPAILKIYPHSKEVVKHYVKKNKIDFKDKEDLMHLLDFCRHFEANV